MNLDELRSSTTQSSSDDFDADSFTFEEVREERNFLGMTAVERMFLSIFLFMNVCVLGIALLLATGLRAHGFADLAAAVEASSLRLVEAGGPYEYFDADTGAPAATAVPFFGWTAAIYVDLAVRLSAGSGRSGEPNR